MILTLWGCGSSRLGWQSRWNETNRLDTYEKSFGLKQSKKSSVTEKRTVDDVADAEDFEIDSTSPCPVIECVIVTDSFMSTYFSEEEIRPYLNKIIRMSQERYLDELELNLTLRLIGRI
ncbi:uncharacterized protein LOC111642042 [Centruroides sculpturatus]|uniref:uncharacterized protein LOC111642042 n=1 Tax=Centruroides sculpturatus TaxID=218467 RepID=UPI000C6CD6E7|nr:uncharacterized protein LOC111642042 [Centruroides sculpturatus]